MDSNSNKKSIYKLTVLVLVFLLFAVTAQSVEQWNLGSPNTFQATNISTVLNLTYLSQNSVTFIGAGGQVTQDAANFSYFTANGTLVLGTVKASAANVSTVLNLTYLSQNSVTFIGAGGQVTQDAVNFSYFTSNSTLVVKFIQGDGTNLTGIAKTNSTNTFTQPVVINSSSGADGLTVKSYGGLQTQIVLDSDSPDRDVELDFREAGTQRWLFSMRGALGTNELELYNQSNGLALRIAQNNAFGIGTSTLPSGGGVPVLVMAQASSLPTGFGSNTIGMVGVDVAGTTEAYLCDEAGNCAIQTPHDSNFLNNASSSYWYPWVYSSENPYIGRGVNVDMEGVIREVERLSGKQLLYNYTIPKLSWTELENGREREENNKSRNIAVEAYLRNASETEVPMQQAFEDTVETKTVQTDKIVGNTTEYTYDENMGTTNAVVVPIYETKTISKSKKKLIDGITFNKQNGKFFKKPTKTEAEAAVGENYPHYSRQEPPKWMKDRGAS